MGSRSAPSRSSPSSTAMPTTPIPMPTNRIGVSRSSSPTSRAARAATKGTVATRSPVSELDSDRSAYESSSHGPGHLEDGEQQEGAPVPEGRPQLAAGDRPREQQRRADDAPAE